MDNCFVCCEESDILYRVCKCNIFVHDECFQRLTKEVQSHSCECPVCKYKYTTGHKENSIKKCLMISFLIGWGGFSYFTIALGLNGMFIAILGTGWMLFHTFSHFADKSTIILHASEQNI